MKLSLEQKRKIVDYFSQRPEVAGGYLYGSQIGDNAGSLSDVDVAVIMTGGVAKDKYLDFQLEYINEIQSILKVDLTADVKILNDEDYALIYQASVINQGELIVNNRPKEVAGFVHRIGMLYPDFYPVLKNYYSKMYQRLENGTYAA